MMGGRRPQRQFCSPDNDHLQDQAADELHPASLGYPERDDSNEGGQKQTSKEVCSGMHEHQQDLRQFDHVKYHRWRLLCEFRQDGDEHCPPPQSP
jgi:hypothetical protein